MRAGAHRPRPAGAPCPAPARPSLPLPPARSACPAVPGSWSGGVAEPRFLGGSDPRRLECQPGSAEAAAPRLQLASTRGCCCSGQAPGAAAAAAGAAGLHPGASARRGLLSRRPAAAMPHFTVVPVEDKARAGYDDLEGLSWVDYSQPGEEGAPRQRDPYDSVSSDGEWRGSGGEAAGLASQRPGRCALGGRLERRASAWRGALANAWKRCPRGGGARGALKRRSPAGQQGARGL